MCSMYKEYYPSNLLAPFIDRFWEYKGETGSGMNFSITPQGCSHSVSIVSDTADCVNC